MNARSHCHWAVVLFVFSHVVGVVAKREINHDLLNEDKTNVITSRAAVSAGRVVGNLNVNKTDMKKSRVAVTAGRSSSAVYSVDKFLRTFAEHVGMLAPRFDAQWNDVVGLYKAYCCADASPTPGLPDGGKDASLFIADYSNLPSLAVLVTPNDEDETARFAVVYGRDGSIRRPIFGLLSSIDDTAVKPDQRLVVDQENREVGIYKIPNEHHPVQVYLTTKGMQHASAFVNLEPVLAPPPPDDELQKTYEQMVKPGKPLDHFMAAVYAANLSGMPKLEIPEGYFAHKVKALPFGDGLTLYVRYHHAQRRLAYNNSLVFEHVWAEKGRYRTGAKEFQDFKSLTETLSKLKEDNEPTQMTFILSEHRFAVGWPQDGVEFGTGHNCLIKDEKEQVYIAGEILFADGHVRFNFNSGTFTRQIAPLYSFGVDAHLTQWKGLIQELIATTWDMEAKHASSPEVSYTDDVLITLAPPVTFTNQAFCHSEPWVQQCACVAYPLRSKYPHQWVNYCDAIQEGKVRQCYHEGCDPLRSLGSSRFAARTHVFAMVVFYHLLGRILK